MLNNALFRLDEVQDQKKKKEEEERRLWLWAELDLAWFSTLAWGAYGAYSKKEVKDSESLYSPYTVYGPARDVT